MTVTLMRQHVAAMCWHARQAVLEAPTRADVPVVVLAIASTDAELLGIDDGYIAEAGHAEFHLNPGNVP